MRVPIQIEEIHTLRRLAGIEDDELWAQIRGLRVGDHVRLTFLVPRPAAAETLAVRITSLQGPAFRGKLTADPGLPGLAPLHCGSAVTFTDGQIHSVATARPAKPARA